MTHHAARTTMGMTNESTIAVPRGTGWRIDQMEFLRRVMACGSCHPERSEGSGRLGRSHPPRFLADARNDSNLHCVERTTLISVRRFNWRPASVALSATGFVEPRPMVWKRFASMFGNVLTM